MSKSFLWLELTGRCQLECTHCYAESGPTGSHGTMTADQWRSVLTEAWSLGIQSVQFIGGEPTQHPDFAGLLEFAVETGFQVEVYTNLVTIRDELWDRLTHPQVSLATSYYSDKPVEHERITGRRGSHTKVRDNIREAVRRGIPLRAGIIDVLDEQRVSHANEELAALGVRRIGTDRVRGFGRGATDPGSSRSVSELCGNCGDRRAAVLPNGDVTPCIMSRWMVAGNLHEQRIEEILRSPAMASFVGQIPRESAVCAPDCRPGNDGSDCEPAERTACPPDLFKDMPSKPLPDDAPTPVERPSRRAPAPARRPARRAHAEEGE